MNNRILYTPKEKKYFRTGKQTSYGWMIAGLIICIMLSAGMIFATHLPTLQVQTVSVTGINVIREGDIQEKVSSLLARSYMAGLIPYRFLPVTPVETIADNIKKDFSLIAEVEILKEFPHTLKVLIKERNFFGIICNDGVSEEIRLEHSDQIQCAYLDTDGIAYQKAPETKGFLITKISTDIPSFEINDRIIDPIMMKYMEEVGERFPSAVGTSVTGYTLLHLIPHELRVLTKQGFVIIMEQSHDFENTLSVVKTVLEKEIGSKRSSLDYIDARFGNKVFYKFR